MRVAVCGSVLRWALQRSGRHAAVESRFPKLGEWLEEKSQPTLRQLENFAKATATPFGYFFLPDPPDVRLPIPHFRTLREEVAPVPSPDLIETVQTMERRQAWMREHLIEQGYDPLPFVGSAKGTDDPRQIAREMQSVLGLTEGWAAEHSSWTAALRGLQQTSEDAGIFVVVNSIVGNNTRRKLSVGEFRGFALVDEYSPLVFLNGADGKAAQMFTLAHELAHIWLGSSAAFDLKELQPAADDVEQMCNRVAAEFLVPGDEIRDVWSNVRYDSNRFQQIARWFKVSELVAARRTLDLGLITRNDFLEFYHTYLESDHRANAQSSGGGNFYASQNLRVGRRFAEIVVGAVREGRLLYREAYQLTGLHGNAFSRYAEHIGFGERP